MNLSLRARSYNVAGSACEVWHGAAAGRAGAAEIEVDTGGVARNCYLPLPARPAAGSAAKCDVAPRVAPPSAAEPTSERDVMVGTCRAREAWAEVPLGGHVLQRASANDGLKPYVSVQRGSHTGKHY